jgi:hypothetical protein
MVSGFRCQVSGIRYGVPSRLANVADDDGMVVARISLLIPWNNSFRACSILDRTPSRVSIELLQKNYEGDVTKPIRTGMQFIE